MQPETVMTKPTESSNGTVDGTGKLEGPAKM